MDVKLRIVTASRKSAQEFFATTVLGRTLALTPALYKQDLQLRLFPENSVGLPRVYNTALREAQDDPAVLVFVHDDVYLCDFFWPQQILDGLNAFDIVGVAGNRRRLPNQSAWNTIDEHGTWDDRQFLSGVVAHGSDFPPTRLWEFGPAGVEVKLLDGLILAADSRKLLSNGVEFDERFEFHFYDMDFCRQAESKKLRMGTWRISVIHLSLGNAASKSWKQAYAAYIDKWQS